MERKNSYTQRSLDEMTASELNAAIDDTNFPKNTNSAASTPLDPNLVSQALGLGPVEKSKVAQDGVGASSSDKGEKDDVVAPLANSSVAGAMANGAAKGIMRREHPTPLRMVSFRDDRVDLPGTPRTPRTSTTPGNIIQENMTSLFVFCWPRAMTGRISGKKRILLAFRAEESPRANSFIALTSESKCVTVSFST